MESRLEFLGLKIPAELLAILKRQAQEDDRTLSAYVRVLLKQAVRQPPKEPDDD